MASIEYNKGMVYKEFTRRVLSQSARDILSEQKSVISLKYNSSQSDVSNSLTDSIIGIADYGSGVQLNMAYTYGIRFLDIRKLSNGKRKKLYAPLYNKILWGHFYGAIVPQLRYGLNSSIEQNILTDLQQSYNNLDNGNK